ncbi:NAD-dependent dihydropyrimidine dehydrogenase PreA subunit [Bacteroides reticulotermitis]|nr:4Fe-4S binding protein [Bacteroides reticulotermitis]MBB4044401.1 NAD-dependent dihydropyrimidine dehydrogenase PreA subunit [Bacteroides reticulotermitis]
MTYLYLLTLATGIPATIYIIAGHGHTHLGGIHGKFGIVAAIFMFLHIWKRLKWFKNRTSQSAAPLRLKVDADKCKRCNLCVKRCPAQVFERQEKQVVALHTEYCFQCRKCVAHCPTHAIYE